MTPSHDNTQADQHTDSSIIHTTRSSAGHGNDPEAGTQSAKFRDSLEAFFPWPEHIEQCRIDRPTLHPLQPLSVLIRLPPP
jgi:hypothetical protein